MKKVGDVRHRLSWKEQWFGSDNPTLSRILGVTSLFASLGLMFLGMFVKFVPADGLYGSVIAMVFGFVGIVLTALLLLLTHVRSAEPRAILGIAFMPVLLGFMAWLIFIKALPWCFTRIFGVGYQVQAVLHTDHSPSRRSCDYRIKGAPLDRTFPGHACISPDYYREHPDKDVVMLLSGRRTAMGFAIVDIRHVRDLDAPP